MAALIIKEFLKESSPGAGPEAARGSILKESAFGRRPFFPAKPFLSVWPEKKVSLVQSRNLSQFVAGSLETLREVNGFVVAAHAPTGTPRARILNLHGFPEPLVFLGEINDSVRGCKGPCTPSGVRKGTLAHPWRNTKMAKGTLTFPWF